MTSDIQPANPPPKRMTPELLELVVELIPDVQSLTDLAAMTGFTPSTIRKHVAPLLAIMKLQGTHPKCECGHDRFHLGMCKAGYRARGLMDGPTGFASEAERSIAISRREAVVELLVQGLRVLEVQEALGFKQHADVRYYFRYLTSEQAAERQRAAAARYLLPLPAVAPGSKRPRIGRHLDERIVQDIERLAAEGKGRRSVALTLGISLNASAKYIRAWRKRTGSPPALRHPAAIAAPLNRRPE